MQKPPKWFEDKRSDNNKGIAWGTYLRHLLANSAPPYDLSYAFLQGGNLTNLDLRGSDLRSAYLRQANLSNSNLSHADMSASILHSTNFTNANLEGTNLNHAQIASTTNISPAQFLSAFRYIASEKITHPYDPAIHDSSFDYEKNDLKSPFIEGSRYVFDNGLNKIPPDFTEFLRKNTYGSSDKQRARLMLAKILRNRERLQKLVKSGIV